jgi:hypothetical protein
MFQTSFPGEHDEHPWRAFIVPTARGLERLAWHVAWFALIVKILFFS